MKFVQAPERAEPPFATDSLMSKNAPPYALSLIGATKRSIRSRRTQLVQTAGTFAEGGFKRFAIRPPKTPVSCSVTEIDVTFGAKLPILRRRGREGFQTP